MRHGPKRLFLVCGEPSGEAYAARVAARFRSLHPRVPMEGIGGRLLEAAGVRLIRDYHGISVVGITEVARHLPAVLSALRAAVRRATDPGTGAVLLVDFPEFNFRVGKRAAAAGIPVVYYIPPQLWAWRPGRARTLARFARGVVVPFPFEVEPLRREGVPVRFAGHPLLAELADSLDAPPDPGRFGIPPGAPLVGLLPGSRAGEIRAHLPAMLGAARILLRDFPGLRFALPVARPELREEIRLRLTGPELPLTMVEEERLLLARGMTAAVSASGTATLELALLGVPHVIVYRTSRITYRIGKRLARVRSIGLPNLVAGEPFLPELIQDGCVPDRIAAELGRILGDAGLRDALRQRCLSLRETLRGSGPAEAVVELLAAEGAGAWG